VSSKQIDSEVVTGILPSLELAHCRFNQRGILAAAVGLGVSALWEDFIRSKD
jgi:hypothetical protein